MIIMKNMAISESSHIFNLFTSESFSVNPIEKINMLKDDKSFVKFVKSSWQNYNSNEEKVEKDINDYFGLLKQHLSATFLNK